MDSPTVVILKRILYKGLLKKALKCSLSIGVLKLLDKRKYVGI